MQIFIDGLRATHDYLRKPGSFDVDIAVEYLAEGFCFARTFQCHNGTLLACRRTAGSETEKILDDDFPDSRDIYEDCPKMQTCAMVSCEVYKKLFDYGFT